MKKFIQVKTLLGHKNLDFSIECLLSFLINSYDKIWITIFEDGTLTSDDIYRLQTLIPDSTVIDRNECEAIILKKLLHYPSCSHYRKTTIYARKIFDIMLYDENDAIYIDSDVFFVKKFKLPDFGLYPVFMYDSENAYSFKPNEFLYIKFLIFPKVNSGFFYFPSKQFDLDYIELILKDKFIHRGFIRGISWLEQTVWSFMASRYAKLSYFNTLEVVMAQKQLAIDSQTICVHLVSTYRNHFDKVKKYASDKYTAAVDNHDGFDIISLVSARRPLRAYDFYIERIIKTMKRYINQLN